eukprot:gnl/Spiro4/21238_TR10368_c0_g1_i2.p1 gnl/Spiro4/21238_TR10368_c0_g1~~gnl/Spiro4/21238_TR10368_c0_g1_i2.p1  ORF type:complete len:594 (+),score=133.34 gnl/Spiro4/21238_TR10368_c0_g1_i2:69-1784(+)
MEEELDFEVDFETLDTSLFNLDAEGPRGSDEHDNDTHHRRKRSEEDNKRPQSPEAPPSKRLKAQPPKSSLPLPPPGVQRVGGGVPMAHYPPTTFRAFYPNLLYNTVQHSMLQQQQQAHMQRHALQQQQQASRGGGGGLGSGNNPFAAPFESNTPYGLHHHPRLHGGGGGGAFPLRPSPHQFPLQSTDDASFQQHVSRGLPSVGPVLPISVSPTASVSFYGVPVDSGFVPSPPRRPYPMCDLLLPTLDLNSHSSSNFPPRSLATSSSSSSRGSSASLQSQQQNLYGMILDDGSVLLGAGSYRHQQHQQQQQHSAGDLHYYQQQQQQQQDFHAVSLSQSASPGVAKEEAEVLPTVGSGHLGQEEATAETVSPPPPTWGSFFSSIADRAVNVGKGAVGAVRSVVSDPKGAAIAVKDSAVRGATVVKDAVVFAVENPKEAAQRTADATVSGTKSLGAQIAESDLAKLSVETTKSVAATTADACSSALTATKHAASATADACSSAYTAATQYEYREAAVGALHKAQDLASSAAHTVHDAFTGSENQAAGLELRDVHAMNTAGAPASSPPAGGSQAA